MCYNYFILKIKTQEASTMIYTEQTKKAMIIAYNAHHGQVDKFGVPYIYHPIHLA